MKTTTEQFEQFKAEFGRWQRLLGLTEYHVVFVHEKVKDCYADIGVSENVATVRLSSELDDDPVVQAGFEASNHGRHEALHLLLWRLYWLGGQRFTDPGEQEREWEALVRRIEWALEHLKEFQNG